MHGTYSSPSIIHFRSLLRGLTTFCRIRSYLSTMSKHGRAMLEALVAVIAGRPFPIAWAF